MDANSDPYSLIISDRANLDINRATDYFDEQQVGLGALFYEEFIHIARLIARSPEMFEEKLLFVRRGLMKRFRFQIYYAVDDINHEIDIIAVIHQSQDLNIIRDRLNLEF